MPSPAVRRSIATLGNLAGMVLNGGGGQDSNEDWVAEAIVGMRTTEKGALWQVGQWS
jgi:hypothetical protein